MINFTHILITGGAGFIGANFIPYFLRHYPQYHLINLDYLTYASNLTHLTEISDHPRYSFVQGDINDEKLVTHLMQQYDIRGIIHFAAESHVDNSIHANPQIFFTTNVCGTQTLLHAAYSYWMKKPHQFRPGYKNCRFHHISTDEVYGSLGASGYFTEQTPHAPNSPYSASKSASDMTVRAYHHTYGLNAVITNCSNNYGPKQHGEKLIPTIIRQALANQPIPIYGEGKNVRDWLFVEDHCQAIAEVFHQGCKGEVYNVGGKTEKTNTEVAVEICQLLDQLKPLTQGRYQDLITYVTDRPGHDQRYAVDFTKIHALCRWQPQHCFQQGIEKTVKWYTQHLMSLV